MQLLPGAAPRVRSLFAAVAWQLEVEQSSQRAARKAETQYAVSSWLLPQQVPQLYAVNVLLLHYWGDPINTTVHQLIILHAHACRPAQLELRRMVRARLSSQCCAIIAIANRHLCGLCHLCFEWSSCRCMALTEYVDPSKVASDVAWCAQVPLTVWASLLSCIT